MWDLKRKEETEKYGVIPWRENLGLACMWFITLHKSVPGVLFELFYFTWLYVLKSQQV